MLQRWIVRVAFGVAGAAVILPMAAQDATKFAPATEMPLDRVADSYAIYQQILPSNAIEWSDVKRTHWLLQAETTAKRLEDACDASQMTDLPRAVKPPADRQAEWDEVLEDYAVHCHDRYRLESSHFRASLPVNLLDDAAQRRYWQGVSGYMPPRDHIMQAPPTPNEFKGAAGLHSFSTVYFNRNHTLAATYFGMGCGSLCGNWTWVVMEKTPKGWQRLPWVTVITMS